MTDFVTPGDNHNDRLSAHTTIVSERGASSRRFFLRASLLGTAVVVPTTLLAACGGSSTANIATPGTTAAAATTGTGTQQTAQLALKSAADSKTAFTEIMNDENQHVTFLQSALKSGARAKPTFKGLMQADVQSFAKLSQTLENVGVGAYLMAAPAIKDKGILAAAGSILTIEARHAGFLNALLQMPLSANGAFDKPLTQAAIVSAASPFIASLNGGPDPSAPLKSDADILNFALLLEFLEAEFYSTNVPTLFP
ncbi:MAG TPA: ferritin-like domain-containing protein [Ktedonobacteraceae bacterium]